MAPKEGDFQLGGAAGMPLAPDRRQADRTAERAQRRSDPIGRLEPPFLGFYSGAEPEPRVEDLGRGREEAAEGGAAGGGEVGAESRAEELRVVSGVRADRIGICQRVGSGRGGEPREDARRVRRRHCVGECRVSPPRAGNGDEFSFFCLFFFYAKSGPHSRLKRSWSAPGPI